jgi:hypothetical protein
MSPISDNDPIERGLAAIRAAAAGAHARLWLYRTAARDDDGNPLAWGAVEAPSLDDAELLVTEHLLEQLGEDGRRYEVGFYAVTKRRGVFITEIAERAVLTLRRPW